MEELQIFKSQEFGTIRATEIDGEPYFVGKDVAEALGYDNRNKAVQMHVDDDDKKVLDFKSFSQNGTTSDLWSGNDYSNKTLINESGVYALVFSSKLPTAKQFKHWVTSDVLPAIRKTGGYIGNQESMSDDEIMAKALLVAQKTIEQRNKQIEAMQPKALFADAVASSDTSILMNDLAKLIKQNGVDIGGSRLWTWMRENGYIFKHSCEPTQKSMEMGLFEVIERTVQRSNHAPKVTRTTKVTGKGQIYFMNKFLQHDKESQS